MPGEHDPTVAALAAELDELDYKLWKLYTGRTAGWQLSVGPLHVRREINSRAWFLTFVGFCLVAFLVGAILAVLTPTRELGVAMVVGSIFACASFVGQVWTVQMQNERTTWDRFFGADERRMVRELAHRREQVADQIEQLSSAMGRETRATHADRAPSV